MPSMADETDPIIKINLRPYLEKYNTNITTKRPEIVIKSFSYSRRIQHSRERILVLVFAGKFHKILRKKKLNSS